MALVRPTVYGIGAFDLRVAWLRVVGAIDLELIFCPCQTIPRDGGGVAGDRELFCSRALPPVVPAAIAGLADDFGELLNLAPGALQACELADVAVLALEVVVGDKMFF
mgnify:CR=1 FL=1